MSLKWLVAQGTEPAPVMSLKWLVAQGTEPAPVMSLEWLVAQGTEPGLPGDIVHLCLVFVY